ncbi:MAG: gas vesicle protein GvpG [Proteobacteria bacterium]|nr:gas vesicle protein GvpG [Pseudomonadota bacterium]
MLLIDNLMLLPFKGLLGLAKRIHEAAEEEMVQEKEAITGQLTELYMMLETEQISEEEFETRETELLERLDAIEAAEEEDEEGHEDEV